MSKSKSGRKRSADRKPTITEPSTRDKDKALQRVIGMWEDREDMKNIKEYRRKAWRNRPYSIPTETAASV